MMMKKIILFFVAFLLPLVTFSYDFEVDGLSYNLVSMEDRTVCLVGMPGSYKGDIVIPGEIKIGDYTFKVDSIADYACSYCNELTSVTICEGVRKIGYMAFRSNDYNFVDYIKLPKSLIYIGNNAFECMVPQKVYIEDLTSYCKIHFGGMESSPFSSTTRFWGNHGQLFINNEYILDLVIPEGVESVNYGAFSYVYLNSVRFPESMKRVSGFDRSRIKEITFGNNTISIGGFSGCNGLTKLEIPNSVQTIEEGAFMACNELEYLNLGEGVNNIRESAFASCSNLSKVYIKDNCENIENRAFQNCSKISKIYFGAKVKSIGDEAFDGCAKLDSIIVSCTTPPTISSNSFSLGQKLVSKLIIPKGCKEKYLEDENWSTFNNIFEYDGIISDLRNNQYVLTYIVDGNIYKSISINCGEAITPEPVPTKEGYTFSGWSEIPETMPAHDVTVTGSFTINKYKLTYIVDGEEYKSYKIEFGATITPEAEPTKEGYTFSGWSGLPETMPANDVTVTGTFTINKYKLTYSVDGEEYKSYEIEYGSTITSETEPTKEGYTFSGWSDIPETMPAKDVTVTGTFTANKYKLTYFVDGEEYKSYDIEYGSTITSETEPTKEGYTFSGWSDLPETMPAKDVTVTGTFTVNKYKLTYSVDGEEYKSYDIEYGSTITSETEPTKEGYTFSGWSDLPETMPAKDVTVTGTFTVNKYKLTYSVDGEEYKSYDIEYGSTITSETEPTKEGYTFSGWNDLPETMPAKDVTVTGTFTVNKYKLTYSVDGEEYKSYDIEYGSTITSETEPTKEGYTFSGWSDLPETMPANDVTVTGTFTINKYKVTYMIDGEVYQTVEVEYGSTITPPNPGDREGYDFAWGDYPSTMPAKDITINGSYTATDIRAVLADESDVKIYTVSGKPSNNLQKGVNILRYKDGRTQKLIIK